MQKVKVAIMGLGGRGGTVYAAYQDLHPDKTEIVAIADIDGQKRALYGQKYKVPHIFNSAEEFFTRPKMADAVIIATQDRQHIDHAVSALDLGYPILLEKPIATSPADCITIREKAKQKNLTAMVCHVLRYTKFYNVIKEQLAYGKIGKIVTVQAIESVGYWHQAHSFVRGNWRDSRTTSPMILQKCCHDMDILLWLIGKHCVRVSSYGSLSYFKPENAPDGSAPYCAEAGVCRKVCPYDAEKIYIDHKQIGFKSGNTGWPCDITAPVTENGIIQKLKTSPYGRCVFRCDNNVVDHQIVNMLFENDITVSFTMSGVTDRGNRGIVIMGTLGQIEASFADNTVKVTPFGKESEIFDITKLTDDLSCHGGGDNAMMDVFLAKIRGEKTEALTDIDAAVESHMIAFAAEYSRLHGGQSVNIEEFEKLS